jgi:glycosyltransferase 2 family protein
MDEKTDKKNVPSYFNVRRILKTIAILVVSGIAVNVFATLLFDKEEVLVSLKTVPWYGIFLPFLSYSLMYLVDAIRLKILFRQFGERVPLVDAYFNASIGYFFGFLTPISAGQQPFMIYHLSNLGYDTKTSTNIVFSRYVIYTLSVFVLLIVCARVSFRVSDTIKIGRFVIILGMLTSTVLSVAVSMILVKPYFVGRLALRIEKTKLGAFVSKIVIKDTWAEELYTWSMDLRDNISYLWRKKFPAMLIDISLNLVNTFLAAYSVYLTVIIIGEAKVDRNVPFIDIFVAYLIVNIVVHFVPTPGGTGGYEAALTLILSQFLGNTALAVSTTVIWRVSTYYLQILYCGFMFLLFRRFYRRVRIRDGIRRIADKRA